VLALVGLYGVIAYVVSRREKEIGIRLALGQTRPGVMRLVLRDVGVVLAVGITVGLLTALAAGRGARSLLFGLEAHDPLTAHDGIGRHWRGRDTGGRAASVACVTAGSNRHASARVEGPIAPDGRRMERLSKH
jgi:ABC-type antimicrobial peptide transport system permease subunit